MTTHDEQQLRDALQDRAGAVETPGDFVGAAIGLARRRRRRAVAAGGVATVLVLGGAAGVATWARGPVDPRPAPVPATRVSESPSPTPSPVGSSSPTPTSTPTASSPTPTSTAGEEPPPVTTTTAAPWALDGTVHVGDRTVELPSGRVVADLAALEDGRVLVLSSPAAGAAGRWLVLDDGGDVVADLGTGDVGTARTDGRIVATQSTPQGRIVVSDTRGRRLATHAGPAAPTGVAAGRVVLAGTDDSAVLWDPASGDEVSLPDGSRRFSADGRFVLGTTGFGMPGEPRCWFTVDLRRSTTTKTLERCGGSNPGSFAARDRSPDGRHLLGSLVSDGGYVDRIGVVDARTGAPVGGNADDTGWSWAFDGDDGEILFSRNASDGNGPALRNELVRCSVTLRCTQVAKSVALTDGGNGVTAPRYVVGPAYRPVAGSTGG